MRESVTVVGYVTRGTKNVRMLLARVSDGLQVTMLVPVDEVPADDSVITVEFDKTRPAREDEVKKVSNHKSGKTTTRKRKVKTDDSGVLGPVAASAPAISIDAVSTPDGGCGMGSCMFPPIADATVGDTVPGIIDPVPSIEIL